MSYSRTKVWIAAEILTASDLNTEFSGNITNENDLDSRLIAEVSVRSALESEYNTFYGAAWNAGSGQIANDKVALASMKNSSVGTSELVAQAVTRTKLHNDIVDPAVDIAGARTLGTGAVQACAGNDSRLNDQRPPSDHSVHFGKIQHGSITLLAFGDDTTEISTAIDTWQTKITHRIYIPADATTLRLSTRIHDSVAGGGHARARITVGGLSSTVNMSTEGSAYHYIETATLDVSSLSGWQTMLLQIRTTSGTVKVQGYTIIWE